MSRMAEVLRARIKSAFRGFGTAGLAVGLVVAAALVARSWLAAHESRIRLAATLDAQQQVIAAAQHREQQRAAELKDALAQIAALKQSVSTPQQVIRELPQYLPLPQPIQITTPEKAVQREAGPGEPVDAHKSSADPAKAGSRLNSQLSPPVAQMPAEDLKPLFDFVQDCRACKAQLAAAQADLQDEHAKIAALTKERDAAVKAAKGGGFWSRVKRGAKWFAVGVGVGAVAAATSR